MAYHSTKHVEPQSLEALTAKPEQSKQLQETMKTAGLFGNISRKRRYKAKPGGCR
jgi:hypothetical protein